MALTVFGARAYRWPGFIDTMANTVTLSTAITVASGVYYAAVLQAREAMAISHVGFNCGAIVSAGVGRLAIEQVAADGTLANTLWAANTSVLTSGITQNQWSTMLALGATANISVGQKFAVTLRYDSGTSLIIRQVANVNQNMTSFPYNYNSGALTRFNANILMALGASSTAIYRVHGLMPISSVTTHSITAAGTILRGARFRLKFPARCIGLQLFNLTSSGDFKIGIYDDSGTELSSSQTTVDGNHNAVLAAPLDEFFDAPVSLAANTWYNALIEGVGTTSLTVATLPSADFVSAFVNWGDWLATSGTAYNALSPTTDQVPFMSLLLDSADDGTTVGGGTIGIIGS